MLRSLIDNLHSFTFYLSMNVVIFRVSELLRFLFREMMVSITCRGMIRVLQFIVVTLCADLDVSYSHVLDEQGNVYRIVFCFLYRFVFYFNVLELSIYDSGTLLILYLCRLLNSSYRMQIGKWNGHI